MYTVIKAINSTETTISFSLPHPDWSLLQESTLWERLAKYFEACQSTDTQKTPQERAKILEVEVGAKSNEQDVLAKVDNCIIAVCDKIQKEDCAPEEYANTVKALAELVSARASIF